MRISWNSHFFSNMKITKTKKIWMLVMIISCIVGLFISTIAQKSDYELVIRDQRTKVEYVRMEVLIGDQIELSWIHSVEKTPWHEVLEVTPKEELKLVETRFQSFGAGVPHDAEGEVFVQDGYTVMTGLNQIFSSYRWIHSQKVDFTLKLNGKRIVAPEDISHHQAVEMFIEKR